MITKEMLLNSSAYSKRCENYRGVLTTKEAEDYLKERDSVVVIQRVYDGTFFFTDDHCFGVHVLPKDWVPCTSQIPQRVKKPREGLDDGIIKSVKQYISVYEHGHQVTSIDELVTLLNNNGD